MNHNKAPQSTNFEATDSGLLLPSGHESNVNPAESALNSAMHIGMSEQGLGSIKYGETSVTDAKNEANEKAFTDMLNPANVIELKSAIDHAVERANAEESHLGNTKDGSKQAREAKTADSLTNKLVNEYMHVGDKEGDREIPELVRNDLSKLLGKSYKELEAMIDKAETEAKEANSNSKKNTKAGTKAVPGSDSAEGSDAENEAGKSNSTKTEMVVTTDLEEAKAYWENNIKQQGIPLEDYLSHEKAWLVAREVEADEPEVPVEPVPPTVPVKPVPPTVPVKPVPPTVPVKPVPPTPTTETPSRPEVRRPGRLRKVGKVIAGLALLGTSYIAGRVNENYIIKSHDTEAVDSINKMQDNTRNLEEQTQEDMASNFERTTDFFEGLKSHVGQENFTNMQKMYDQSVEKFTKKYGSTLSQERIEELAQKEINAKIGSMAYQDSLNEANK